MNYKYYIVFILAIIAGGLGFFIMRSKTTYTVTLNQGTNLFYYKNVFIDVQNKKYSSEKEKRSGINISWVRDSIRDNLKELGFNIVYLISPKNKPKTTDMLVRCVIEEGLGPPALGRHFNPKVTFIKNIEIVFIDALQDKIIARAIVSKRFLDRGYHLDDIDKIFNQIKERVR